MAHSAYRPGVGISLKIGAVLCFTLMGALIKGTGGRVPTGEVVFFRSLLAVPVMIAWLAYVGQLSEGVRTTRPLGHLWRGLIGTTAMGLMFTSLMLLPLPEVTAIQYATPMFITLLAALMLGERIRLFRMTAVIIGLVGVIVVLYPRLGGLGAVGGSETLGAVLMLTSTLAAALAQVQVRRLVATERPATVALYFSFSSTFYALLTLPFGWVLPGAQDMAMLVACGLIGGVGQGMLSASYQYAPASVVAPFDYVSIFFATALGMAFFDEVPTRTTLAGAAIVIAAGVLIIWRERQLGMNREASKRAKQPPT
ncbi:DMT family transporter [Maritimibacter sp. UBA3975]|uniref:DMT family transporter n=1 Tax=Maritimibacter sp. UBA3975 TaxID=1946833 RepID=UPI000C0BB240|nr:DMT family transporter [Maritimibacter sp. UBA3975]MAM61618.1 EamA family transporter [Maritimibacter sp.]